MNFFSSVKKTKSYFYLLKFFAIPLYDIFWEYILNFKNKIVSVLFQFKTFNKNYINLEKNSKKLVTNNTEIINLSNKISSYLTKELIDRKIQFIKSKEYSDHLIKISENQAQMYKPFSVDLWDSLNVELKKEILKFASSDLIVKSVTKYLGVFPRLTQCKLNLNVPNNEEQAGSQLWHRDDFGYKGLDFFIAITSVDDDNGPLISIKKKDPLNIFYRVKNEIGSNRKGERGKISDEYFNYLIDKDNDESLIKLKGNPGTCLIIDSFRNYHKGGFCKKNYRIVLRFSFMTDDSTAEFNKSFYMKKDDFKKLVGKNDFFSEYLIRDKGILYRNKIPKMLFSMYHALSIKK